MFSIGWVESWIRGDWTKRTNLDSTPVIASVRNNIPIILVWLAGLVVFFVNSTVDNAVVFHDEYIYKIWATRGLSADTIIDNGIAPLLPNSLYFFIYGFASYAGTNFYLIAQFFNVLFWLLGVSLLYDFSRLFELSQTSRNIYLLLIILLPFSIYTKYFMPEAMYFFVFCLFVSSLFRGLFYESQVLIFCSGLAVGLLYYVKPHAIIIFIVTLIVLYRICDKKNCAATSVFYTAGFLLIYAIGKLVFDRPTDGSALGVYDQMLKSLGSSFNSFSSSPAALSERLARLFAIHISAFLLVFGVGFLVLLSYAGNKIDLGSSGTTVQLRVAKFGTWITWTTATLIAVSVLFSVLAGESERIHTRYYSFIYPLWMMLIVLPIVGTTSYKRSTQITTFILFGSLFYFVLIVPVYSPILPISLVSDSPELGFVFMGRSVFLALFFLLSLGVIGFIVKGKNWLLITALCITFVASHIYVRTMQKTVFRGPFTDGLDAVSVVRQLGSDVFKSSLVIGENRDQVSKFLFGVNSAPVAVEAPPGDVTGLLNKYNRFDTVLVLSPGYIFPVEYKCELLVGSVVRCVR